MPMPKFEVMNKDSMNSSWSLDSRLKLALAAAEFFNVENSARMAQYLRNAGHTEVPRGSHPFSLLDFANYLEAASLFSKKPNYFRVQHIVARMASLGLLVHVGYSSSIPQMFHEQYLRFHGMFGEHFRGNLWLAPLFGPELLYGEAKSSVVHLTGSKDGEVVGGSGLVIQSNYILTCRHVVEGVDLDTSQEFQGMPCTVEPNMIYLHSTEDIALIRVDRTLTPLKGAVFRKPIIAQSVYTIGYPRLPNTRNASLTMQPGSVTNECVISLSGETLFLYSAISRPGNSGGPILSEDGYVVGVAVEDHSATYAGDQVFSPHYAGIPAEIVVKAVEELVTDIQLVIEELD